MLKKISLGVLILFLFVNLSGCVALLAGAAGGAGTASWLSGKLTQNVDSSFERTIQAAKSALKSLRLKVNKETTEPEVAQIMSTYTDGKTIWIDVRRVSEKVSKVEVRVGGVSANKEAEEKIMKRIVSYL